MEQPQAAGIPEKALHFSFPPCSAFPVPDTLWAWAPPLPPSLSSLKCGWGGGGNAGAASGNCVGTCTPGLWEVADDGICHAGVTGRLRSFSPAVSCAGGKGNQPAGAAAFLSSLIRASEVTRAINQPRPSISGGSDVDSGSVLMHLLKKKN